MASCAQSITKRKSTFLFHKIAEIKTKLQMLQVDLWVLLQFVCVVYTLDSKRVSEYDGAAQKKCPKLNGPRTCSQLSKPRHEINKHF